MLEPVLMSAINYVRKVSRQCDIVYCPRRNEWIQPRRTEWKSGNGFNSFTGTDGLVRNGTDTNRKFSLSVVRGFACSHELRRASRNKTSTSPPDGEVVEVSESALIICNQEKDGSIL